MSTMWSLAFPWETLSVLVAVYSSLAYLWNRFTQRYLRLFYALVVTCWIAYFAGALLMARIDLLRLEHETLLQRQQQLLATQTHLLAMQKAMVDTQLRIIGLHEKQMLTLDELLLRLGTPDLR